MTTQTQPRTLLDAVLVTGASAGVRMTTGPKTIQAYIVGTGAVAATVLVQVCNIDGQWITLETITLTDTTTDTDYKSWVVPWGYVRANCTAISGTGAALTVTLCEE